MVVKRRVARWEPMDKSNTDLSVPMRHSSGPHHQDSGEAKIRGTIALTSQVITKRGMLGINMAECGSDQRVYGACWGCI